MEQSSAFFPMHASTCFWLDLEWQFSTWWIKWHENKKSSSGGCSMTCTCAAVPRKAFEILSHLWDTLNLQLGDWRCGHFRDHFIRKCLCRVLRHPSFLQSTAKHLASLWNLDRRIWADFFWGAGRDHVSHLCSLPDPLRTACRKLSNLIFFFLVLLGAEHVWLSSRNRSLIIASYCSIYICMC